LTRTPSGFDDLPAAPGSRAVDDLASPVVPGYVEADARLAWRVSESTELSVSGANLLESLVGCLN